jgi:hypothetical protein
MCICIYVINYRVKWEVKENEKKVIGIFEKIFIRFF